MFGAHDLPYIFPEQLKSWASLPLTWIIPNHDGLGEYGVSTLWNWPLKFLYGLGGKFGLDYNLLTLFLGIFPFIIFGTWGLSRIFSEYNFNKFTKTIAILFFLFNPFTLMLIDGGQVSLAVVYSLLPLAFSFRKKPIVFTALSLLISIYDIRFLAFIYGLLILTVDIKAIVISLAFVLGINAYWLFPAFLVKLPLLPTTYSRSSQVSFLSFANFSQSLTFYQPHWPKNIFGNTTQTSPYLFILPVIIFSSLVLYRKDKNILCWSIVAIGSVFLAKGSNPPFESVYQWLFNHLPGFSLFRDPVKFYMLIGLSYSILLGFVIKKLKDKKIFLIILVGLYGLFLIKPFVLGQTTGLLSFPRSKENYLELEKYLQNSPDGGILWVPSKPALGYSDAKHPSTDALTLLDKRAFLSGAVGSYDLLNLLRESKNISQLLEAVDIKYLAFAALDPLRDSPKPEDVQYKNIFANQLASMSWVGETKDFGNVKLLLIKNSGNLFRLESDVNFVVGADGEPILAPTIYIDAMPGLANLIANFPAAKIQNTKKELDLIAGFAQSENITFPARNLDFNPGDNGWWKKETVDLVSWRDFLQTKYGLDTRDFDFGGGFAVSEGQHKLNLKLISKCVNNCVLLARVMKSNKGGEILFNDYKVDTYRTDLGKVILTLMPGTLIFDKAEFVWQELGPIDTKQDLAILTTGTLNVLNALAVVDKNDLNKNILQGRNTNTDSPKLDFQKIDTSKYVLKISGVTTPRLLVFSQNYDPLWSLSGEKPLPVYNLINGFVISKDGEYVLEYSPQKYVNLGIMVSVVTVFALVFARLKYKNG